LGVLSQLGLNSKEGEITGAKKILFEIPVCGNTISGDAIFCQTEICKSIVQKKGEYIFMVKGNQSSLQEEINAAFAGTISPKEQRISD
jgi:predicted transposase YbfD/YdcC